MSICGCEELWSNWLHSADIKRYIHAGIEKLSKPAYNYICTCKPIIINSHLMIIVDDSNFENAICKGSNFLIGSMHMATCHY